MITLKPMTDKNAVELIYDKKGLVYNENSGCVTAECNNEVLGLCLYDLDKEKMVIRFIEPLNDIPLADGILRSTLHVAAERSIMDARYADTTDEDFFQKTGFIKNREEKSLNINKLFGGCNCQK